MIFVANVNHFQSWKRLYTWCCPSICFFVCNGISNSSQLTLIIIDFKPQSTLIINWLETPIDFNHQSTLIIISLFNFSPLLLRLFVLLTLFLTLFGPHYLLYMPTLQFHPEKQQYSNIWPQQSGKMSMSPISMMIRGVILFCIGPWWPPNCSSWKLLSQ